MANVLVGTASDSVPAILASGRTDVATWFVSMSARHPEGRDAEYLAWHSLDHRPEQHRLGALRASLRLVSTPACRAARAASHARYDAVDHLMTYLFSGVAGLAQFTDLSKGLAQAGRVPYLLPSIERAVYALKGKVAAPRIKAGADVLPWWPARGVYVLIEQGEPPPPAELGDTPGVAGMWWGNSTPIGPPYETIPTSDIKRLITYCFLDEDPVQAAQALRPVLEKRWKAGGIEPLIAAPFNVLVPYQWDRSLP
jgi:hypothetical protein